MTPVPPVLEFNDLEPFHPVNDFTNGVSVRSIVAKGFLYPFLTLGDEKRKCTQIVLTKVTSYLNFRVSDSNSKFAYAVF
jgi:hypothetical protein